MNWIDVSHRLPVAFSRVWVQTDNGRQSTGYVNGSGVWVINCPKITAMNPVVVRWRE